METNEIKQIANAIKGRFVLVVVDFVDWKDRERGINKHIRNVFGVMVGANDESIIIDTCDGTDLAQGFKIDDVISIESFVGYTHFNKEVTNGERK